MQVIRYITLVDVQDKDDRILVRFLVEVLKTWVLGFMYLHVLHGVLHGWLPLVLVGLIRSVLTKRFLKLGGFLYATMIL